MKRIIALLMAVMLVASVAVISVAAKDSPTPVTYYSMTAEAVGAGEASVSPAKVEIGSNGTATFTATEKGGKFQKWELHCEYDIVEGSLTSATLVIRPKSDVHGIAFFEGGDKKDGKKDDGSTSPKTGDMTIVFATLMLVALGAGVFAVKKIKE